MLHHENDMYTVRAVAVNALDRLLKRSNSKTGKILMSNYVDRKQLYSQTEVCNFQKDNGQNR